MKQKNNSGKYWPYMILGFLFIGITLGYWTIKNTISMPVHESNEFMQKYQDADKQANKIEESQARFDAKYNVTFSGLEKSDFKPKHLKRKPHLHYALSDNNSVTYSVKGKDGAAVTDANITFLLTRPQTEKDDVEIKTIANNKDGTYTVSDIKVANKGRYILRAKIAVGQDTKYLDIYGFKK
ncbi:MAG TPA: hypothetical protein ENK74_03045 [Nitratifractor sp.]|jgi:hypothetical protein|nr:hypothetical protein [Nitratifractor sp.]